MLLVPASLLFAGLAGCASVPADWGRSDVAQMAAERGRTMPQVPEAQSFTTNALSSPLSVDTAIQLALINNPVVRREAAKLGFAAGEVYDAGRLANPVFSLTRLSGDSSAGANVPQLTLGLAFNFVKLLFLPANNRFAQAQLEAAKLSVAASALDLASDVEVAWYEAVGADQLAQMREAAAKAARASAELAQRYFDAGNISQRALSMERAAASQATLAALSSKAKAVEAHSALNRLMGLAATQTDWTLEARLAEPLAKEDDVAALQKVALASRLDLASSRRTSQAIADRYGVTRHTRLVNGIEVGAERERDYDGALDVGPTLSVELPLFNWGGGRVAAIQAALDQAEAELDGKVLDVSNQVQLAAAKVGAARALAEEYRTVLIPSQEAVVAQAQKEQNYMLIGIFEVILAKQQEYEAYTGYIEAVRDYWTARSELTRAVGRRLPSSDQVAPATIDPVEVLTPKEGSGGHDHLHMDGMSGMDMKGVERKNTPGMSGMDHALHAEPAAGAADPHADHDMGSIPMNRMPPVAPDAGEPHDRASEGPLGDGPDCAAMKDMDLSKIDSTVAAALEAQCGTTHKARPAHGDH